MKVSFLNQIFHIIVPNKKILSSSMAFDWCKTNALQNYCQKEFSLLFLQTIRLNVRKDQRIKNKS